MTTAVGENLFLDGLDYFIFDVQRNVPCVVRDQALAFAPTRNERVIDWALAWPDLAPHVTRLLFDSRDRIRHVEGESASAATFERSCDESIRCERWDDDARNWVSVPSLGGGSEPLTAFEAAIVLHDQLRPQEPRVPITFSRGDGLHFVQDGKITTTEPTIPHEKVFRNDFRCNRMRNERVRRWIMRQDERGFGFLQSSGPSSTGAAPLGWALVHAVNSFSDVGLEATEIPSGASLNCDVETNPSRELAPCTQHCPTCAFRFATSDDVTVHLDDSACGLKLHLSEDWPCRIERMSSADISFRIESRYLTKSDQPRIGAPIRVCKDGVPWFVMRSSPWMWSSVEIAAIEQSIPFHRCYRVAELPFIVFDPERPRVPQVAASCNEIWTLDDVVKLLKTDTAVEGHTSMVTALCARCDAEQPPRSVSIKGSIHPTVGRRDRRRSAPVCGAQTRVTARSGSDDSILHLLLDVASDATSAPCSNPLSVITGPYVGPYDHYLHVTLQRCTDQGIETRPIYLHRRPLPGDHRGFGYWANSISLGGIAIGSDSVVLHHGHHQKGMDRCIPVDGVLSPGDDASGHVLASEAASSTITYTRTSYSDDDRLTARELLLLPDNVGVGMPPAPSTVALRGTLFIGCHGLDAKAKCKEFIESLPVVFADIAEGIAGEWCDRLAERPPTSNYYSVTASDSFIYVDNLQCHVRQDVFQGDDSLRTALILGAGSLSLCHPQCTARLPNRPNVRDTYEKPICIRLLRGSATARVSIHMFMENKGLRDALISGLGKECLNGLMCTSRLTCPDLHFVDSNAAGPSCRGNHGDGGAAIGLVKERRLAPMVSILVVELRKHCNVTRFLPNSGLQNAIRYGRGKLCRFASCCPNPRRCPLLHVEEGIIIDNGGTGIVDKPLRSLFVRNLDCRMNAWDFIADVGLQQALALGEGCLCTVHDGHTSCALLHLDHSTALRHLRNCKSLSRLRTFAAMFGLGVIVPPYNPMNQLAMPAVEFDAQRRKVEQAYQSQFKTTLSVADVTV